MACKKYSEILKKIMSLTRRSVRCVEFSINALLKNLNHFVDEMAVDAIQMGGTVPGLWNSFGLEFSPPGDFRASPSRRRCGSHLRPIQANLILSLILHRNADYAQLVVELILFEPAGELFRQGIRPAAKIIVTL